ncbi:sigma-54-dependent Fis family transcriptional regulator [Pseudomonas mangiferae]|uniref:Sigma-54-dependent Fis family transcriptional regulator n=1 Tax=Pseudomonas mangiferae TaxID=2593654 RepID=A0A553GUD8_9PSED|nr:sigma-54-dependent Fis family transcriptional regulator [Pseudomonas mangiferae]TRX73117.1 sigma-54-dependent Fis family transcriptional regulator [Pseudomonas mangiferae]
MTRNDERRHAQQVLTVAQGRTVGTAVDPSIARSWRRCLEQYRLDPALPVAPAVLESARMRERREPLRDMLEIAGGELHSLHRQLAGRDHAVLLTDARGVILDCVTHEAERRTFERAGLWLGADWSEACEGTNGIGTCLAERQVLTIHQAEHFRSCHTGLTCSASPVFDPHGDLLAVLDVSSARSRVSRQSQFHTLSLVSLSARAIETRYFLRRYEHDWLLRFHPQPDGLGLLSEGLLAFDGEGRVLALNAGALAQLGCERETVLGRLLEDLFDTRLDDLLGRATPQPASVWPLHTRSGQRLHAQLRGRARPVAAAPIASAAPVPPQPPAPTLCLADPALQRDFVRAGRVYERDVPLLLHGETGSGKEAFAQALHRASSRAGRPFVALNCAAIPETLIESELFGYRGGSFTGARKDGMRGKLQQADGGTLFLDEIGDMPLALQARLLRVLEERQVVPLGGEAQAVDLRLISATHRDLGERVAQGTFREDLYYRLNGLVIELPPLRARSDRSDLLEQLLRQEARGEPIRLTADAHEALHGYPWPGNIRQLRNVLRTLAALCEDGWIRLDDLPADIRRTEPAPATPTAAPLDVAEGAALRAVLEAQRWHVTAAAEQLGISRNTLYRKLRKHGISRSEP